MIKREPLGSLFYFKKKLIKPLEKYYVVCYNKHNRLMRENMLKFYKY